MANRPDPNNPQPGDVFLNVDGRRLTIIARHGGWCWALDGGDDPTTYNVATNASYWKPAPPTPPERWGVLYDTFWSPAGWGKTSIDVARNAVASESDTVLVYYVGTVVVYDDGEVVTWSAEDMARNAVASESDTVLVHYVGTVVEP